MKLNNKIALITGGSGTIGKVIARALLKEGCQIILVGRSQTSLEAARQELASETALPIEIYPADVGDAGAVQNLMCYLGEKFPRLDILVTAAGVYGEIGTIEQCDPGSWMSALRSNLFGTFLCLKYALPLLRKSSAAKAITFAGGGEGALPNFSAYASSKGAVLRFTETAAAEFQKYNISVNAISPGLVASGLTQQLVDAGVEKSGKQKYDEALDQLAGKGNTISPEKAAALAVFLASDESNGLTGKNISAVWDNWQEIPKHIKEIQESDVYNWRRIKPKDRGYDW